MPGFDIDGQKQAISDSILTLDEAAAYLKLAPRTIHRMIQRKEIPCARVGGQWRFAKAVIDDWLLSKMQVVPSNELEPFIHASNGIVHLSEMLSRDFVIDGIAPGSSRSVLQQMTDLLTRKLYLKQADTFLEALLARERMAPTALGHGVAVPHVRRPQENVAGLPPVVLGICRPGTDFGQPDEEKVRFFFLLGTSSEVVHLRLLRRISTMFRNPSAPTRLLSHTDPGDILCELVDLEGEPSEGGQNDDQ